MKSKAVTVPINPKLEQYLAVLQKSGFFGNSLEEVCERLICEGVDRIARGSQTHPLTSQICELLRKP